MANSPSWIPLHSLIAASDPRSAFSNTSSVEDTFKQPRHIPSLNLPKDVNITKQILQLGSGTSHLGFVNSHQSTQASDIYILQKILMKKDMKIKKLKEKYDRDISRISSETEALRLEVQDYQDIVDHQKAKLARIKQKFAIYIQQLQARHEIRLQQVKVNYDQLITEINHQITQSISKDYFQDMQVIHQYYQKQIQAIQYEHSLYLNDKDEELSELYEIIKSSAEFQYAELNDTHRLHAKIFQQEKTINDYEKLVEKLKQQLKSQKFELSPTKRHFDLEQLIRCVNKSLNEIIGTKNIKLSDSMRSLRNRLNQIATSGQLIT